jgi:hypothetical protein
VPAYYPYPDFYIFAQVHAFFLAACGAIMAMYAIFGFFKATPTKRAVSAALSVVYLTTAVYLIFFYRSGWLPLTSLYYLPAAFVVLKALRARRAAKAQKRLEQARANHARDALP